MKRIVGFFMMTMLFVMMLYGENVQAASKDQVKSLSLQVNGGGEFVRGISDVNISFKICKKAKNVMVYIVNSEDETVYQKKYSKCKANKLYTFTWNGKEKNGNYVEEDDYRVVLKVLGKNSTSSYVKFYSSSDFAGGYGAEASPYQVESLEQLKQIREHNNCYFKQIADIDFGYEGILPLFSEETPFNGIYNGNGYSILNCVITESGKNAGIFNSIGSNGKIENLKFIDCVVTCSSADYAGILVGKNYGTISNCKIERGNISAHMQTGGIAGYNAGKIVNCSVINSQVSSTSYGETGVGAITGYTDGSIIGAISDSNSVSGKNYVAGIAGINGGSIISSSVTNFEGLANNVLWKPAGIVSKNTGTMSNNSYDGLYQEVIYTS